MDKKDFVCPVCGNSDPHAIGIKNGVTYCRKCISFRGESIYISNAIPSKGKITLTYDLSLEQKELSNQLVYNYKHNINSLVYAVCGSGKTEIVLSLISYALQCGDTVGFAIPRRDVVKEIAIRLKEIFKSNSVVTVYGGHTKKLKADIVCLTTHQLFRYDNYFNLLIMDEIDAFPYNGNYVLESLFKRSLKGSYVLMSATPPKHIVKEFKKPGYAILRLDTRFHRHPLPVPIIYEKQKPFDFFCLFKNLKKFQKAHKPVFIFCPTIEECEITYFLLSLFFKNGNFVHSKRKKRPEIIDDFRAKKYWYLVTTSVLERGVTVKDLQVIVYHSQHMIYNCATLVQIAGRAGRKIDAPEGEVIYIGKIATQAMYDSIEQIKTSNKNL